MSAPTDSSYISTPPSELEARVERVSLRKDDWLATSAAERISYLRRCIDGVLSVADRWVQVVCEIKGIAPGDPLEGEEWIAGPMPTVRNARLLIQALESGGRPRPPATTTRKGDGRTVARVFPASLYDRVLFTGFRAEVVLREGMPATQGQLRAMNGRTALVLGGGNVSSIAPMDVFYKLFAEDQVVVLKMNPVNAVLGPLLEEALRPLIDDGFLAIVYGGAEVGAMLANHPRIDTLHVTGSNRTYDAIVWGADAAEQAERKASGQRKNEREFSAELGCVTPILIVPGPWSAADMRYHAEQVAGMVVQNASFNCNAAKVLVLAKGWLQRGRFLEMVREELGKADPRRAYYPGAKDRYQKFVEHYPQAKVLGATREDAVPWTLIPDVAPESGEYALTNEAFCGVLAEVSLDATGPVEFLEKAVPFANDRCWGTLSAGIVVHPTTHYEHEEEVERAIAELRYGGIAVNVWPAVNYALGVTSWGAYPGNDARDIGSGVGVVHNAFLFDHPEKSIVRAPFRVRPKPPWFPRHRSLTALGKKLTYLEAAPSLGKLLGVVWAAVRA
jgi:acyl-CoA reductase-like NAD-dependent aldehyde dehydrogenase